MRTLKGRLAIFTLTGTALVIAGCSGQSVTGSAHVLTRGTWGGENAGAILDDTVAHVHIGCTLGNFPLPAVVDDQGRFSADGNYTLRAYPIAVGPELPAVFTGVVNGNLLTISVAVDDTVEKRLVPLGPVTVVLGREPRMQACPICRSLARPQMGHPLTALLRPAT